MKQRHSSGFLLITTILGALAIVLGAFGAHALKESLSIEGLESFNTAVKYQMYHVLVLLFVQTAAPISLKSQKGISYLFYLGILCFSGSIYAITLGIPAKFIWFVTPLGGLLFIIGWLKLGISIFKGQKS